MFNCDHLASPKQRALEFFHNAILYRKLKTITIIPTYPQNARKIKIKT